MTSKLILIAAVSAGAIGFGTLRYYAQSNVTTLGFWFGEDVTFELSDPARIGGPLTGDERRRIVDIASDEVHRAFQPFAVRIVDQGTASYRVRVTQLLTFHRTAVSGQSNVLGPLGGLGEVSFVTLASQAMTFAPPGTDRAAIIDAIGRGIGRAAVHEFAHQLLPQVQLHATQNPRAYEFRFSARPEQFYGPAVWDMARPFLVERLSAADRSRVALREPSSGASQPDIR